MFNFLINNIWPILIGFFVIAHFWMMFKGHGGHAEHGDADEKDKGENKHKSGGCCH